MKCAPCTHKRRKSKETFYFFHTLYLNFYLELRQVPSQEKETEASSSNAISSSSSILNSVSLIGSQQQPQATKLVDSSAVSEPLTRETPAQDLVKGDITTLESKIASPSALKEPGFSNAENTKHLKDSQDQPKKAKQRIKALISGTEKQRKGRVVKKKVVSEFASLSAANASKLKKFTHSTSGRPPLEDTNPDLHKTIVDLTTARAGADSRRCTDVLLKEGYVLSRAALYLRLIPK